MAGQSLLRGADWMVEELPCGLHLLKLLLQDEQEPLKVKGDA